MRDKLVEVAARLLAEEGEAAVTARRVTAEAGVSTMAVYTHFGSMDELLAAIWRDGYAQFGAALEQPTTTDDPVADWMVQGWGYRHFALSQPHLYQVMFGEGLASFRASGPDEHAAVMDTFHSLLRRLERCVEAGRFAIDDVYLAGEVVWASVHGHCVIELGGYHAAMERDPRRSYAEMLLRGAIGFGDAPPAARASLERARRRARRAEHDA